MRNRDGSNRLVSTHGKAIAEIGAVSVVGILASAGFQIAATRGLGPKDFGLLAAFLALINIASIGSAALRNSVAVQMASAPSLPNVVRPRKFLDSSLIEALALGVVFTIGLVIVSPWLASSLDSNSLALILTAATVGPYFIFSRGLGLLQGVGATRSVVLWSTGAQVFQFAFAIIVLALGYGAIGILLVFLVSVLAGTAGSNFQARNLALPPKSVPFSIDSSVVLVLTVAFAWTTNVDVILVRAETTEVVAGSFAAAAVLVKTTLILPATLSLYLLPRFVSSRNDPRLTRLGVNLTVAVTLVGGLAIFLVLYLAGESVVALLFGSGYGLTVGYLPVLALSWIPWAVAQAVLVRITAIASRTGLAVLLVGALFQWFGATALLPDVNAMIILNGGVGSAVALLLYTIHLLGSRQTARPRSSPGDSSGVPR